MTQRPIDLRPAISAAKFNDSTENFPSPTTALSRHHTTNGGISMINTGDTCYHDLPLCHRSILKEIKTTRNSEDVRISSMIFQMQARTLSGGCSSICISNVMRIRYLSKACPVIKGSFYLQKGTCDVTRNFFWRDLRQQTMMRP